MLRNFISTLRCFKTASVLNIIGLGVSFAAFILIMIQVWNEYTAGTDDHRYRNIYRLELNVENSEKWYIRMGRHVFEKFAEVTPQVEASGFYTIASSAIKVEDTHYGDLPTIYLANDLSQVVEYRMVEGVFGSALAPKCALINRSNAERLFAGKSAMGQRINIGTDECIITGVYEDFPENSMSPNGVVMFNAYGMCNAYFLLNEGADTQAIAENFSKTYGELIDNGTCRLVPLADTYFANQYASGDYFKMGNRTTTLILLSIALLVILIAIINFVNFAMALSPIRIRALNIRGVFGSTRQALRAGIVSEAMFFSLVSYLLALLLVAIVCESSLTRLFKVTDLTIASNLDVVVFTGVLAICIGALSGVYPALYCTRFRPALVLKGSFGFSAAGRILRSTLLGVQFIISISLIIASLFIHLQNGYLLNKNLGYNSQDVIVVRHVWDRNGKVVAERINGLSMVNSAATFDGGFGQKSGRPRQMIIAGQDTVQLFRYEVEDGFTELMNIPVIQGRSLLDTDPVEKVWDEDGGSQIISVLIDKSALRALGTAVDSIIKSPKISYRVVGVTDDVIGHSLYSNGGMSMFLKSDYMTSLVVRTDAVNSGEVIKQIKAIMNEVQPYGSSEVDFFDTRVAALYQKERDVATLITLFSLLAIVISLIGVFGLVLFETQYRRREIGLRKINGATVNLILVMFNRKFAWLVVVCFVIATPIAYYGVAEWLSSFPYRTEMYWWVFAVSLLIVLAITLLTVTIQSWRAATENPVKSLRSE